MDPVSAAAAAILLAALAALLAARRKSGRPSGRKPGSSRPSSGPPRRPSASATKPRPTPSGPKRTYPGDFTGKVIAHYDPHPDDIADPGEVVWTWVPYEDDHSKGKDRPVLIVGRHAPWLLALMMSSQDHDRDAADEARWGRRWMDIGAGPWDRKGRPSEVRLDRVIRIHPDDVRREGAVMDRATFDAVVRSL